jgi:MFS family permease
VITARHRSTALLVSGCYFMEMLDGTIVTTAAPRIGAALHAPATEIGLVVTAYLLTLAVLIPLSGWLTRRLGNRVVFLTATRCSPARRSAARPAGRSASWSRSGCCRAPAGR